MNEDARRREDVIAALHRDHVLGMTLIDTAEDIYLHIWNRREKEKALLFCSASTSMAALDVVALDALSLTGIL